MSFFTDASKNQNNDENDLDDHVGFSIYSPSSHLQFLFMTHSFSSIFSTLAILHALEYISTNSIAKSVIFTDSKSVTEALFSINLAHSYNYIIYAIKQKLYEINSAGFENTIVWIPTHSGILGNETADYLAKRVISKGQISPKLIPHSDFCSIPRKKYIVDSIKFLKTQGNLKGIKYFNSFEEITLKPWFHKLKLNRESIVTCCRLRSDHNALNHSLHRCNLVADLSCPCGLPTQDADHIFWSCPYYNAQRRQLVFQLEKFKKSTICDSTKRFLIILPLGLFTPCVVFLNLQI